jgi:hypothetical protein
MCLVVYRKNRHLGALKGEPVTPLSFSEMNSFQPDPRYGGGISKEKVEIKVCNANSHPNLPTWPNLGCNRFSMPIAVRIVLFLWLFLSPVHLFGF